MATPTHKTASVSGIKVAYTTYNLPSSKPVLAFIHGWLCSSALWHPSQDPLCARHPCILIDFPGHGESEKPENTDYHIELFVDSINAVLEAEGVRQVVFVAHSAGGVACTNFLRAYGEERVKGIVYCASHWLLPIHYMTAAQRRTTAEACKSDDTVVAIVSTGWGSKSTAEIQERVRTTMAKDTPMHVRLGTVTPDLAPPHWRSDEVFSNTPMLHILNHSEPPWDSQHQRHLLRLETEKWEDVSHFLFMEEGERFNRRVERFLEENHLS